MKRLVNKTVSFTPVCRFGFSRDVLVYDRVRPIFKESCLVYENVTRAQNAMLSFNREIQRHKIA